MADDGIIRIELPVEIVNEQGMSQVIGDALVNGTHNALRLARREVQSFQDYVRRTPIEFSADDVFRQLARQSAGLLTEEFARAEGAIVDVNSMADAVYDNIVRWVGGAEEFADVVNRVGHTPESFQQFLEGFSGRAVNHIVESFRDLQGLRPVIANQEEYDRNQKISEALDKIIEKRKQLAELEEKQNANYSNPLTTIGTQTWVNTEKEITNTRKELAGLLREAQDLGVQSQDLLEYLPESFRQADQSAQQFESTLGQVSNLIVKLFPGVQGLSTVLGGIQNIFHEFSKTVDQNSEQLSNAITELDQGAESTANSLSDAGQGFGPWGAIASLAIDLIVQKLNQLQSRAQMIFNIFRKIFEVGVSSLQKFGQMLLWVGNLIGKVVKSVFSAFKNIPKVMSNIKSFFSNILKHANKSRFSFTKLFQTLLLYGIGIRSLSSLFMKFRSAVIEGFKSMAKYSDRFNQAMTNITSLWGQFKGQLSAILEPIITAIAPLLDMIITKLTQAALAITKFFGAFFGYAKVLKATKVVKDYASAVNSANKQLAGFDELNNLTSDSGSGAGDNGNGWEWVDSNPDFLDLWQKIKDTWAQDLPDFSWLGRMIANKLSDMMESIPWPKIFKVAYKAGFSIGTFLNGFFTEEDGSLSTRFFDNVGKTIANGINTIFTTIRGFIRGFKFDLFGQALGSGFVTMVNTIQWDRISQAIVSGLRGVLTTISNFLNTIADPENGIDVPHITRAIEMLFKGIFDDLTKFVNETNWDDLKNKILEFFNIDVNEIAKKISGFITSLQEQDVIGKVKEILLAALGTAGETDEENTGLAGFINALIQNTDITQLILDIIDFCVTIGTRITENAATIAQTLADNIDFGVILQELFNLLDSIELVSYDEAGNVDGGIVTSFLNFIETILGKIPPRTVAKIITTFFDKVIGFFGKVFSDFGTDEVEGVTTSNADNNFILNWIKELINNIDLDLILADLVELSKRIGEFLGTALDGTDLAGEGSKLLASLIVIGENIISGILKGINDFVFPEDNPLHKFFDWVIDSLKKLFGIASPAKEMEPYGEFITAGIIEGMQSKIEDVGKVFEELKKKISEKFESTKLKISEKLGLWKAVIDGKIALIKATFENKFTAIKDNIIKIFETLGEKLKTPINAIIGFFELMANGAISVINSLINDVNNLLGNPPEWIQTLAKKTIGVDITGLNIPSIPEVSIPRLAKGAVIPPNKEFMAVLGDQKSGTNIETPLSTMLEAFNMALSQNGGNEKVELLMQTQISLLQTIADRCGITDRAIADSVKRSNRESLKMTGNGLLVQGG